MKYKVIKLDLENLFSKKTSIKTIKVKTFFPCPLLCVYGPPKTFSTSRVLIKVFSIFLIYRLAFGLISIIALLK